MNEFNQQHFFNQKVPFALQRFKYIFYQQIINLIQYKIMMDPILIRLQWFWELCLINYSTLIYNSICKQTGIHQIKLIQPMKVFLIMIISLMMKKFEHIKYKINISQKTQQERSFCIYLLLKEDFEFIIYLQVNTQDTRLISQTSSI
ncbi:hypothetical protein pb186bvf_006266 [Paramecium bursaria]